MPSSDWYLDVEDGQIVLFKGGSKLDRSGLVRSSHSKANLDLGGLLRVEAVNNKIKVYILMLGIYLHCMCTP